MTHALRGKLKTAERQLEIPGINVALPHFIHLFDENSEP